MKAKKRLQEQSARMEIQESWAERFQALTTSRAAFCDKYDIDRTILSRLLKCQISAGELWIDKVETAMKAESL